MINRVWELIALGNLVAPLAQDAALVFGGVNFALLWHCIIPAT
jgi:hypothetical protein